MFDLEYKPHKLMDPTNRIGAEAFSNTETMFNDCLVKSVNQMICWKFFTCREQTSRLMKPDMKTIVASALRLRFKEFAPKDQSER